MQTFANFAFITIYTIAKYPKLLRILHSSLYTPQQNIQTSCQFCIHHCIYHSQTFDNFAFITHCIHHSKISKLVQISPYTPQQNTQTLCQFCIHHCIDHRKIFKLLPILHSSLYFASLNTQKKAKADTKISPKSWTKISRDPTSFNEPEQAILKKTLLESNSRSCNFLFLLIRLSRKFRKLSVEIINPTSGNWILRRQYITWRGISAQAPIEIANPTSGNWILMKQYIKRRGYSTHGQLVLGWMRQTLIDVGL